MGAPIDWSAPLELLDGTPVTFIFMDDFDGTAWVDIGDDMPGGRNYDGRGRHLFGQCSSIRNRVDTPAPATLIRNLLAHAVFDRERDDECIAAVEAAEAWLEGVGT